MNPASHSLESAADVAVPRAESTAVSTCAGSSMLGVGPQAVTLQVAAAGCTVSIKAPPRFDTGASKNLSEEFFSQLSASSDYGAGQADRALVACP